MRVEMNLSHEGVHLNRIADLTAMPDGTHFAHLETAWGPAFLIVGNPPMPEASVADSLEEPVRAAEADLSEAAVSLSPDQVERFKRNFNAILAGNSAMEVPISSEPEPVEPEPVEPEPVVEAAPSAPEPEPEPEPAAPMSAPKSGSAGAKKP